MIWALLLLLTLAPSGASRGVQATACATWQECRSLALEAAERQDYETFHDMAWAAVQRGPRNDPSLMTLLARAQSVSGRPGDALVMLRRLLELGVSTDAENSDDFRRVRALPEWPDLQARMAEVGAAKTGRSSQPADAPPPAARDASAGATKSASATANPGAPKPPAGTAPLATSPSEASTGTGAVGGASDALRFFSTGFEPAGLAHDSVSNRFIIGDRNEHKLTVIGERSQRLSTLTGAQAAGFGEIAAIEIDRHEGDLWVASVSEQAGQTLSVLHKLQLISGRQLYSIQLPADAGPVRFADVTLTPSSTVLVLDRDGRRLYRAVPRSRELRLAARLEVDTPSSVAARSDGVAYVAHPRGLLRVDLGSRATRPVTAAKGVDLSGLAWIRWHRGSIVAVQSTPDAGYHIVRIALDGAGRTARTLTLLHHAVPMSNPSAAALSGDVLYYLTGPPHGEPAGAVATIVRRVTVW